MTQRKRPPLEWQKTAVFVGPLPPIRNVPEHARAKARRVAACQVFTASAGYDHRKGVDRVKISYTLGWFDPETEEFSFIRNIPDERASEFLGVLRDAMTAGHLALTNETKKATGSLTSSLGDLLKGKG